MPQSGLLKHLNVLSAVLLLFGGVANAVNLRVGLQVGLNAADLALTVFVALLLIKRNRTWLYLPPLLCWAVFACFTGTSVFAVAGDLLMNLLTALLAAALLTNRLPGLRALARRFWFLPALIGYACRLVHWVLAIGRGEGGGSLLLTAILLVTAVDLGYLLMEKWFAEHDGSEI